MSYPRIAQALFNSPWQIQPETLISLCDQFVAHAHGQQPLQYASAQVGPSMHPQVETAGGLALVRVHGVLGRHLGNIEMACGGYDVSLLQRQMRNIADDEAIRAVVMDFNSPGGQTGGLRAAADAIGACRAAGKKVYAYTSSTCASAAYYLAAACDEIHAESTAAVGSISTIVARVDDSKKWAMEGKERRVYATGKYKANGMSGKPITDDDEDAIWALIRPVDDDFKNFVRARRGLKDEDMQGQWWWASSAPAGLVNSTAHPSLDQFVEAIYQTL